jgi:hypothetical protein
MAQGFPLMEAPNSSASAGAKMLLHQARSKLQRAAPAQTTFTHFYAFNKIKQASIIHK